jgi:hypothetical protein
MKLFQCWTIPIKLQSEANIRDKHWAVKHKRKLKYLHSIRMTLLSDPITVRLPVVLTLIRIAPRGLDFDNLLYAFKNIRDFMSDALLPGYQPGRADDSHLIQIKYHQERGKPKEYAIKIVLEPLKKEIDINASLQLQNKYQTEEDQETK